MGPRRLRLDAELVRRGLARSREHASGLIAQGRVLVNKNAASKPATAVTTDADLVVRESESGEPDFASRGGHKLAGALAEFMPRGLEPKGKRALDAGASTGGFTDVLLRHEVAEVVAVDVGYGQLVWSLSQDPRVHVHDRTNIRELSVERIGGSVDLVVGDLSFISLTKVIPALVELVHENSDMVLMVKPQFEVGRAKLGKGGVVRDPQLRSAAVMDVADAANCYGWGAVAMSRSPLPGPAGNIEYFLWLRATDAVLTAEDIAATTSEVEQ